MCLLPLSPPAPVPWFRAVVVWIPALGYSSDLIPISHPLGRIGLTRFLSVGRASTVHRGEHDCPGLGRGACGHPGVESADSRSGNNEQGAGSKGTAVAGAE